jgi:hypothetical protein
MKRDMDLIRSILLRLEPLPTRSKNHPAIGFLFQGLSWKGREFVDAVRNGDVWHKTRSGAVRAGGWP